MNYRYISDPNATLRRVVARNPNASLHEIWRSDPSLQSMSLDQLALRIGQLGRRRDLSH